MPWIRPRSSGFTRGAAWSISALGLCRPTAMGEGTHIIRRADLSENGTVSFEARGMHFLVVDIEGEVRAFQVAGPAAEGVRSAAIVDGQLHCPLHGWSIDPHDGRCGAADLCRYQPLPVEIAGDEIRVQLPRA